MYALVCQFFFADVRCLLDNLHIPHQYCFSVECCMSIILENLKIEQFIHECGKGKRYSPRGDVCFCKNYIDINFNKKQKLNKQAN